MIRAEDLPSSPEYLPFRAGPFRMAMGLNELNLDDWIQIDHHYPAELELKRKLLHERPGEIFAAFAGTEASSHEVLELISEHLLRRFPQWFELRDGNFLNKITDESWKLKASNLHPLDLAARLVQEDLCLMQPRGDVFCLAAASVAFPSRWTLSEKIGKPMQEIHAPVPFYAEKIGETTDRFLKLMTKDQAIWRMNWNVHDSNALFQPRGPVRKTPDPSVTPENAGTKLFLRIERQTLRRLARSGDILFTIRTYVRPLSDFAKRPDVAKDLAAALRSLPAETSSYKSQPIFSAAALKWLDAITAP
jgi:hypothetical protein